MFDMLSACRRRGERLKLPERRQANVRQASACRRGERLKLPERRQANVRHAFSLSSTLVSDSGCPKGVKQMFDMLSAYVSSKAKEQEQNESRIT
jgi:hypothetical protein